MLKLFTGLAASFLIASALASAADSRVVGDYQIAAANDVASSKQIERALQTLTWTQFKAVVEAVPKIKADVDAYGPMGWDFVRANYRIYGWKKSIDKLDDEQKRDLVDLIEKAKNGTRLTP